MRPSSKVSRQLLTYSDGQQTRDFIYIQDVITTFGKALTLDSQSIVNLGSSREKTIFDLIKALKQITKENIEVVFKSARLGELRRSCLGNTSAKEVLNWQPEYSLDEGIRRTLKFFTT